VNICHQELDSSCKTESSVCGHSLIFVIQHSHFLEVGTKIEIYNDGLLSKGKIETFYLDVGRITGNFHFSIVPVRTLGLISPVREGAIFLEGELDSAV